MKNFKQTTHYLFAIALAVFTLGCAVQGSDLVSTEPSFVRFVGSVHEYNNSTRSSVSASIRTLTSDRRVELDQGESLSVYQTDPDTSSSPLVLEESLMLGFLGGQSGIQHNDRMDAVNEGGSYVFVYKDEYGDETEISIEKSNIVEITSHTDGEEISGDSLELTWDSDDVVGSLELNLFYLDHDGEGMSEQIELDNTGSYTMDISDVDDLILFSLHHITEAEDETDFGYMDLTMHQVYNFYLEKI